MDVLLFEDSQVAALEPLVWMRPAYDLFCAGTRLIDRLREQFPQATISAIVRPHLVPVEKATRTQLQAVRAGGAKPLSRASQAGEAPPGTPASPTLVINARLAPTPAALAYLVTMCSKPQGSQIAADGDRLAAAWLPQGIPTGTGWDPATGRNEIDPSAAAVTFREQLQLFDHPHDVLKIHLDHAQDGIADLIRREPLREIREGVFVADGVLLGEGLVTDTQHGPIAIQNGAQLGPHCFLRGPVLIGPDCKVHEHASLKNGVILGNTVRAGGEIEASIFDSYSNKQHYGFVGHSYLGKWVNLGAGTCNSNLKNTYGNVRVQTRLGKVDSGLQFLGTMFGDYSRSAINTSIFTGLNIGACSVLYGGVTKNVPSFVNYAPSFGSVTEMSTEVMLTTQQRAFARRGLEQREHDRQLLRDVFALTAEARIGIPAGPPVF